MFVHIIASMVAKVMYIIVSSENTGREIILSVIIYVIYVLHPLSESASSCTVPMFLYLYTQGIHSAKFVLDFDFIASLYKSIIACILLSFLPV